MIDEGIGADEGIGICVTCRGVGLFWGAVVFQKTEKAISGGVPYCRS